MTENIPSIFDGAGEIEQAVGNEAVASLKEAVETAAGTIPYEEYMRIVKTKTMLRKYPKISRNDPCPCGSGKKYKNCCMNTGKFDGYEAAK